MCVANAVLEDLNEQRGKEECVICDSGVLVAFEVLVGKVSSRDRQTGVNCIFSVWV